MLSIYIYFVSLSRNTYFILTFHTHLKSDKKKRDGSDGTVSVTLIFSYKN